MKNWEQAEMDRKAEIMRQTIPTDYIRLFNEYVAEMAKTPEVKVKDRVKKALDDLDVYYTMPMTGGYGNSGVPDILACIEGVFFGIECKAGNNKPTALQEKHMADIVKAGGVSMVIDETNVGTLKELILAKLGDRK